MRCPKCGKDVELQNKQVGVDENGKPIFNEYAICRDCKKQWNLDKHKVKKAAAEPNAVPRKKAPTQTAASTASANSETAPIPQIKKSAADKPVRKAAAPGSASASPKEAAPGKEPVRTKRPVPSRDASDVTGAAPVRKAVSSNEVTAERRKSAPKKNPAPSQPTAAKVQEEQKYGNIPSEKVRTKREHAVRQNYEEMLATDPDKKPAPRKKPAPVQDNQPVRKSNTSSKTVVAKIPEPQPEIDDIDDMDYEPTPKFRAVRIIFGILSLVAFGFFAYKGFMTGLSNISAGKNATTGTIYIVLALCMLVAGLLLLIMQKKSTVFAFVLPMLCYLGSAVFAFFKRGDDKWLLYGAIAGAIMGVIFLILTFASGRAEEYDDFEDPYEDDAFDDDFDD